MVKCGKRGKEQQKKTILFRPNDFFLELEGTLALLVPPTPSPATLVMKEGLFLDANMVWHLREWVSNLVAWAAFIQHIFIVPCVALMVRYSGE